MATETYRGKQYRVRSVVQMQARRLASFLRGATVYNAFAFKRYQDHRKYIERRYVEAALEKASRP